MALTIWVEFKQNDHTTFHGKQNTITIPGDKGDPGGEWINQTKWRAGAK